MSNPATPRRRVSHKSMLHSWSLPLCSCTPVSYTHLKLIFDAVSAVKHKSKNNAIPPNFDAKDFMAFLFFATQLHGFCTVGALSLIHI